MLGVLQPHFIPLAFSLDCDPHVCPCLTAFALGFPLSGMLFPLIFSRLIPSRYLSAAEISFPREAIHNPQVATQLPVRLTYFNFPHSTYHSLMTQLLTVCLFPLQCKFHEGKTLVCLVTLHP